MLKTQSLTVTLIVVGLAFVTTGCSSKPAPSVPAEETEPGDLELPTIEPPPAQPADAKEAPQAPTPVESGPEATTPPAEETKPEPKPETKDAAEKAAEPQASAAKETEPKATGPTMLGTAELTAGIPGEGPLTVAQIQGWLDNAANHAPLTVALPLGLSAAVGSVQIPDDNPMTKAKIELGRQLYFDRRLSKDSTVSCADCHHPDEGYARHTQFGVGIDGQEGGRNSPISYNRIFSGPQFWDGRAASLEEQAVGPIANPIEMGNTHDAAVALVKGIDSYRIQFEKIFGDVSIENIGKAIATFERAIVTGPSPYDYYEPLRAMRVAFKDDLEDLEGLKEDDPELYEQYMQLSKASKEHPISESAQRGRDLFFSKKANCTACHAGANFADEKYHNLGVGMDAKEPDLGRFAVTKDEKDRGAFKTPTTRNVALSAPYMHDGSQKTLEEVVEWYAKGGHPNPHLSKDIKKLELTDQDKKDLVAFMKACTGDFPKVETGRLPE